MILTHPASALSPWFAIRSNATLAALAAALALLGGVQRVAAQGTAFSYQGGLNNGGAPATGSYDFAFALYNDPQSGSQVGSAETNIAVPVSNGLFATTLDFASLPWNGQSLWLQILVRANGSGPYSLLTPRQPVTSSPYAIQSLHAATATTANSVAASNVSGTIPNSALPSSPVFSGDVTANSFSGNGSALVNLNPFGFAPGTAAINISGNAATASIASNVTGNIADSQLSANVPLLNGINSFIGVNTFSGAVTETNTGNVITGTFTGNLSGNATTANSASLAGTAVLAANLTGSLSGDVTGTQGATIVARVGGQPAANVAAGTSAVNAASSANTPGAIVTRDASGNFAAGAITASYFAGDGGGLSNVNPASLAGGTAAINIAGNAATAVSASNVTGNIADFQLSTNVALLNGSNSFTGTNLFSDMVVATNAGNVINGSFTGNLTGNATMATTTANFTGPLSGDVTGTQGATVVASIGGLSAANVAAGASAANAATSTNMAGTIVMRDASGNFAAGAITASFLSGNGGGLTNLNPASLVAGTASINISGNAATASSATQATTAVTANNFTGSLLGQVVGTQGATTVLTVGGQSAATVAAGTSAANSATSGNTPSTIVKRDASGNFSAGGITATTVNGAFSGNGSGLTSLNASQLTFGSNGNIDLGSNPASGDSDTIRIGAPGAQTNTFIAGIYGATAASGVAVYVTSSNQLGTLTSSRRFKRDIHNMDDASDALLALHPVTFRYKPEIDSAGIPQFGLVAEEVEKVNPDLVAHDAHGRPYTVRYEAVNAMLLNEFLKEHRKVEAQTARIDELSQRLNDMEKIISQLAGKQ